MKSNELQLVTFEQAKRLKAAGFDWNTNKYYDHEFYFEAPFDNHNNSQCFFSAPTVALALKWFRDVKGMYSMVEYYRYNKDKDCTFQIFCSHQQKKSHQKYIFRLRRGWVRAT